MELPAEAAPAQAAPDQAAVTILEAKLAALTAKFAALEQKLQNADNQLLAQSAAAPLSFEDAFARLDLRLPELGKFEPQPVQLPDSHPFKASMLGAKVMGKFVDPTKPDFLLTEMFAPLDQDFERLDVMKDGELVQSGIIFLDEWRVLVLIGTSGAGKTLYTYKLANKKFTLLFVCNRHGNGGSEDMGVIIEEARSKEKHGHEVVTAFVKHSMGKAVALRMRVYEQCIKQYGAEFRPHHWAMAQLYPTQIFGSDIFKLFQEMAVEDGEIRKQMALEIPFHRIVIDEAQIVDDKLPDFFPSEKEDTMGSLCRSLLSPFVKALAPLDPKILICGTGLSAVSVYATIASPMKKDVGQALIGISKYFSEEDILKVLESWGIPRKHAQRWAPVFVGRPRHTAFLAAALVDQQEHIELEIAFIVSRYNSLLSTMKRIDTENPQKRSSSLGNFSLLSAVRHAALKWLLGREGFLVANTLLAIKYGVASLAKIGDNLHCVVREPLLLEALLTKDPTSKFELSSDASDAEVGYRFEDYLGLRMPQLVGDISELLNQSGAVDAKFKRQWQFPSLDYTHQLGVRAENGDEAAWLTEALASPTPPSTVCFPGTAMGPDLIVCAHAKDDPSERLVVLIQVKSGKASTPNAFLSLGHLYCENRNLAPSNGKKPSEEVQTTEEVEEKKKFQTPERLKKSKKVVDELLAKLQVVRLVIKPQAGSDCDSIEGFGNVVNVVLDKRNRSQFPSLEHGLKKLEEFKNAPKSTSNVH